MAARVAKKDRREIHVELFDGRGTASVYVVDGSGRMVSEALRDVCFVVAVHSREEAIAAARRERPELFEGVPA